MNEGMFFGLLGAALGLGGAAIGVLARPATEGGGTALATPSGSLTPYQVRVNLVVAWFAVKAAAAAILISQTL